MIGHRDLRRILACGLPYAMGVSVSVIPIIGLAAEASDSPAIPVDGASETALLAESGKDFLLARSAHFVLAYDVDASIAEQRLAWMENTYRRVLHFCQTYKLLIQPLRRRLQVVCSKDWSGYDDLTSPGRAQVAVQSGFYDASKDRSYFFAVISPCQSGGTGKWLANEIERLTVQHEVAHQLIDALCPTLSANMPPWLSEGLACAFEAGPRMGVDGYRAINEWRARDAIRRFGSPSGEPNGLVREVLAPGRPRNSRVATTQPEFYAAGWSIVYYLQNERPEKFETYIHRLAGSPRRLTRLEQIEIRRDSIGPADSTLNDDILEAVKGGLDRTEHRHPPLDKHFRVPVPTASQHLSGDDP